MARIAFTVNAIRRRNLFRRRPNRIDPFAFRLQFSLMVDEQAFVTCHWIGMAQKGYGNSYWSIVRRRGPYRVIEDSRLSYDLEQLLCDHMDPFTAALAQVIIEQEMRSTAEAISNILRHLPATPSNRDFRQRARESRVEGKQAHRRVNAALKEIF